jgi:hypothetical protein
LSKLKSAAQLCIAKTVICKIMTLCEKSFYEC